MKFLVFGKDGQVGKELSKHSDVISFNKVEADYNDINKCISLIVKNNPSVVINAVAKTNVDLCEINKKKSMFINSYAPIEIAKKCKKLDIPFLHISTDYVFDGNKKKPYKESDITNPINYYGLTKLNAERGLLNLKSNIIILRTSWVFSNSKNNFIYKIMKKIEENPEIDVVYNQIGSPTSAEEIAKTCIFIGKEMMRRRDLNKIYHYSGYPLTSFYNFAKEITKILKKDVKINKIKSEDFNLSSKKPLYTYLNCNLVKKDFGIKRPRWRENLQSILKY